VIESDKKDLIFAVDDLPENLQMLKLALRNSPFELVTATSGEDALEWLRAHTPDLILMDIQMPGMDGYETTIELKKEPRLAAIPVLFISGITDQNAIVKCFEAGAVDYVSKPFKRQELIARIETHLEIKHLQERIQAESAKISAILSNILPDKLVQQLKNGERPVSETYPDVVVMFTDFRNFTGLTRTLGPDEAIRHLNHLFYAFDEIVAEYNLERVKTIGDGYFAIGGVNTPSEGAPLRAIQASMAMQEYVAFYNRKMGSEHWSLRIGAHIGPVIAGVIGFQKIAFDVWGDAVNVASRLQSIAKGSGVVISEAMFEEIRDDVNADTMGVEELRNLGGQHVLNVTGLKQPPAPIDMEAIHNRFASGQDLLRRLLS
jgi:CheY-like chemotaxis protein